MRPPTRHSRGGSERIWLILGLIVALVGLLGPFVVGVTYCETKTEYVSKTRLVPESKEVDVSTMWNITWYSLNMANERYENVIASKENVIELTEDWKDGALIGENKDYVGLKATAIINVPDSKMAVKITLGADDYAWLYVDGVKTLELGERAIGQPAYREFTQSVPLSAEKHALQLEFKEIQGYAKLVLDMDKDVKSWKETVTITKTETYQDPIVTFEKKTKTITAMEYIYLWLTRSLEGQSNCSA